MIKNLLITIIAFCLLGFDTLADNKIILFGDSLMSGYGLNKKNHLSTQLKYDLKKKGFLYSVINASVSGDTSSGGRNRIKWILSEKNIEIVILCLGANDMLRGIQTQETKRNLDEIIRYILSKNIKLIFAGMIAPLSYGQNYKEKFDGIFSSLAKKYNLTFIPFLLENVALVPHLNQKDGMHPNKDGIKIISKLLTEKIIKTK